MSHVVFDCCLKIHSEIQSILCFICFVLFLILFILWVSCLIHNNLIIINKSHLFISIDVGDRFLTIYKHNLIFCRRRLRFIWSNWIWVLSQKNFTFFNSKLINQFERLSLDGIDEWDMLRTWRSLINEYLHIRFQFIKYLRGIDSAMYFMLEFTHSRILKNNETALWMELSGEELHGKIIACPSLQSDWFLFAKEGRKWIYIGESFQPLFLENLLFCFLFLLCHGESLLLFLWRINHEGDLIDYNRDCECSYFSISKLVGNSDLEFFWLIESGTNSPNLLWDSFRNYSFQLID